MKLQNTVGKQITTLIRVPKKIIDTESGLIPIINETIHSLKNPNHINKISNILPEIWLPNFYLYPSVLVVGLYHTLYELYGTMK